MELEYSTLVLPLDDEQQAILDRKAAEGWQLVPGIKPIGIWLICRELQHMVRASGIGTFHIDESKIFILRNGKLIDKDGNEVSREAAAAVGVHLP